MLRALQYGLDDTICPIAVFESCHGGWMRRSRLRNAAVDISHEIAECIRPGFLMAARQSGISAYVAVDQRWILLKDLVSAVSPAYPQFILVLLPPQHRCLGATDLQNQVVLMAGTHLARSERTLSAVIES